MAKEINKKVIGASKHFYDGIKFDSKLEIACYQLLKDNKLYFKYNENKYILLDKFRLSNVSFYQAMYKKKKLVGYGEYLTKKGEKQAFTQMTYSPDFVFENDKLLLIIETKGNPNDVYPYKRKIFLDILERDFKHKKVYFFEPRNKKQIIETIKKIKDVLNEEIN